VHLLPLDEKSLVDRVVVALPERIDIVADVAVSRSATPHIQKAVPKKLT
jgi:hypothetical protein